MEADDPGGGGSSLPVLAVSTDLASQHHGGGAVERGSCRVRRSWWRSRRSWSMRMSIARICAALGVAWNTASDAILAVGAELLVDSADRFDGVTTVGVDEHVWRYTRNGDNVRHRHHRPDPDKDQNRPITPSGRGRGPLEADDRCLGSKPRPRRSGTGSRSPRSKRSTPSPP